MGGIVFLASSLLSDERSRHALLPRPSTICQDCWEGPFAAYLGLFGEPVQETGNGDRSRFVGGPSLTTTWDPLESRVAAGCRWCEFLAGLIRPWGVQGAKVLGQLEFTVGRYKRTTGPPTHFSPVHTQEFVVACNGRRHFQGYVCTAADDPAAPFIVARRPILDVGSKHALSLAKVCVDECVHGHERCGALLSTESDPPLPTRLVDCTDPAHPRLASTDSGRGRYTTLSYVWGEDQPHRTTMSNIAIYSARIDISRLPQTIRDAIHVTHALGIQYLWADSLCIIQDSTEDKQRELGRMHLVYRHAYVTIIAANARKVSEGFLQVLPAPPRDVAFPFFCPPPHPHAHGDSTAMDRPIAMPRIGEVYLSPIFDQGRGYDFELYNINSEPISARGWCLQEYFLSPRALIFTSETLQFRCRTATHNVGDSYYEPKHERRLPDVLFHPTPPRLEPGSKEWLDVHTGWTTLVKDYTRRTVGVPSDKLVACGALAQEFQRVLRSDYLAGLWRASLLYDLLWSVYELENVQTSRPAAFRAPSWSWAAIDGEVLTWEARPRNTANAYEHWTAVAEVVRCEVTPEVPDLPFARVTGGSLVLRAPAMRCEVRSGTHGQGCIPVPYGPRERDWAGGVSHRNTGSAAVHQRYWGRASIDTVADAGIQEAWVVPLLRSERSRWVQGLVVVSVGSNRPETGSRQVFRRIGHIDAVDGLAEALRVGRVPLVEIKLV